MRRQDKKTNKLGVGDNKKYYLTVRLRADQKVKLKLIAKSLDCSVSWLISRAINKMQPDWFTDYRL